jgi:tetratricopeptide (TPR) repeat protein
MPEPPSSPAESAGINDDLLGTLYQLSQRYHKHGLYESACKLLEFLLRHDPMHAGFHFALGKALHAHARHGPAVISYHRALKLGLPDIDVHLFLGQCLIFQGRFSDAGAALWQFVGLARVQTASENLEQQVQRARHLLDEVVMPRMSLAANTPRPADPSAASIIPEFRVAQTGLSRSHSMETSP